jgi:chromosome segregation ATPase
LIFESDIGLCDGCGYWTEIVTPSPMDDSSPLTEEHSYALPSQKSLKRRLEEANEEVLNLRAQNEQLKRNEHILESKVSDLQPLCSELDNRLTSALDKYNSAMAEKSALAETVNYLREKANVPLNLLSDIESMGARIPSLLYERMVKSAKYSQDPFPNLLKEFALTIHLYSPKAYR